MDKLKELRAKKETILADMQALIDAAPDGILTDEAQEGFDTLKAETEVLDRNICNIEEMLEKQAVQEKEMVGAAPPKAAAAKVNPDRIVIPAEAKRWSHNLKAFKGQDAAENAFKSGQWFAAAFGSEVAQEWCKNHGLALNAVHQGAVNTTGGYLVPEVLSSAIIELIVQYGAFRANAGRIPMTSDTIMIPRRTDGLEAHFIGEGDAITQSTKSWDVIKLITKDLGVTTRISNQLASDAIISIMDNLASEIALQFATKEDLCGFVGDGTSDYGGIVGLEPRFFAACTSTGLSSGTAANGLVRYDSGYAWSNIGLQDIIDLMGRLPGYAGLNAKFYTSRLFYYTKMVGLLAAAGGVSMTELSAGPANLRFMGYPVVLSEAIHSVAAVNRIFLYFGDLTMAAKFGDRQQMSIASSDSATVGGYSVFERNEIALRGTERFDINVHDVGTYSGTAGPICALISYTG